MRKTFHALVVTTLALGLIGTQTGCKKLAERLAAAAADAGAASGAATGTDTTADADTALDGLVDCLNGLDHSIDDSLDGYVGNLPAEKNGVQPGPTGKESSLRISQIQDSTVKECNAGITAGVTKPEFKDVATRYKAATDKLVPEINAAYKYYDHKDYEDDKFAKGKAMHATMWPLAEEFYKVSKEFRAMVVKANDARMEAELKEVEASKGRNLVFQKLNVMKQGKTAISVGTDDKATAADLEAVTSGYEKAVTEMTTYAAAHKTDVDAVMMWSRFASTADDYLKALKERTRRVRDKTPYTTGEKMNVNGPGAWMVDGSPGKVSRAYNDLVGASNSLKF